MELIVSEIKVISYCCLFVHVHYTILEKCVLRVSNIGYENIFI